MITAEQCRAARALIGLSQDELADVSGVTRKTLADFERGARNPYARTLSGLQKALEQRGVIFIPSNGEGPGVRLRKIAAPRVIARARLEETLKARNDLLAADLPPELEGTRKTALALLEAELPALTAAAADDAGDDDKFG